MKSKSHFRPIANLLFLCLSGCSSTPPVVTSGMVTGADALTPDYVLRARYPAQVPSWANDFEAFKKASDGKGETYFLGESGDSVDRIASCELANISAKRRLAEQIGQLVMSRIGEAKTGALAVDKDSHSSDGLGSDFEQLVVGDSMASLSGVRELGRYWEERDYSQTGGRKRVYTCQAVVVIDDAHLREAILASQKKAITRAGDPVAKQRIEDAFNKIDRAPAVVREQAVEDSE